MSRPSRAQQRTAARQILEAMGTPVTEGAIRRLVDLQDARIDAALEAQAHQQQQQRDQHTDQEGQEGAET